MIYRIRKMELWLSIVTTSVLFSITNTKANVGGVYPRILKCCQWNEELTLENNIAIPSRIPCAKTEYPWRPFIYSLSAGTPLSEFPTNWVIRESTVPICNATDTELTFMKSSVGVTILDNGTLLDLGEKNQFHPGEYCGDNNGLLVCAKKKNHENRDAIVRRCCGVDAFFDQTKSSCEFLVDGENELPLLSSKETYGTGFPTCSNSNSIVIIGDAKDATLKPNGSLEVKGLTLPSDGYCLERFKEFNKSLESKVFTCSKHRSIPDDSDLRFILFPICFIISAVFLAATLAAGWLLPASHHVLHWRCQTHHVACLMLGDLLMATIQLSSHHLHNGSCKALASLTHFFFLAAFFWLNTMCFNIWWTFRDLRPASLEKGQETLRLRVYACYAWGGPLLIAGLAALLDRLPQQPEYTFLRPRFGENKCWFYGDMEILAYFFSPIGLLLAINLLFFVATARELTCGLWKGEFVKSTTERATLGRVCMKLVVVMGVTWVADVVSWMVGGPQYIWYFTDLINAIHGVLIFVVVGCQPQVRAALKRLCNRNPRTNAGRQGNGLSTTSHGMPSMGDSVTQNPSTKTAPLETIC